MKQTDTEALSYMEQLTRTERQLHVQWLKQLSIIDERRLYAGLECESLWQYVQKKLGYSEGTAGKRIQVCRAARAFPLLYAFIEARKLSLSVAARLCPHLTDENCSDLLERASYLSVRRVEEMLATLAPKPDRKDCLRAAAGNAEWSQPQLDVPNAAPSPEPKRSQAKPKIDAKPFSEARFHASFMIGKDTRDKQERLKALTRHLPNPPSMEDIYAAGVQALLNQHDPDIKLARKRPARPAPETPIATPAPEKRSRHISREKQRGVRERAGSGCTFVAPDGTRCGAIGNLQMEHIVPYALGGTNELSNLTLLCRTHNLHRAAQVFGREYMQQWVR